MKTSANQTASELVTRLRKKQISSVDLVEQSIKRIEEYDGLLNAVVVRDFDGARAAAIDADKAIARGDAGELLGLPVTVKESYAVEGLSTSWGVPGMQHNKSSTDAVLVERLRKAGAIILGKTNVPTMLGDWQTENPIYGVTNNPWDLTKTPGGSSGGSAVALAAGYVLLEFGSDLNGSLRAPAHFCGVFAHKPSFGLVPTRGHAPPGVPVLSVNADMEFAVCGPMARSAEDLALALKVIAGPDDDKTVGYKLSLPSKRHAMLKDYRVLLLTQHPLVATSTDVEQALLRCSADLAQHGCTISHTCSELPDLTQLEQVFSKMLMAILSADTSDEDEQVLTHPDYIKLDRMRTYITHQWRRVFESFDILLCPVMPVVAFAHDHSNMDSRRMQIDGIDIDYGQVGMWSALATLTGQPATVMPIGKNAEGLPIGMQIIGPFLEDLTTIGFAELVENELGGFTAPEGFA